MADASGSRTFPLKRWHLRHFKSVTQANLPMSPLTVLVGTNSAGKSTLIQSILLLAQAARAHRPDDAIPLNGDLVRLGRFPDVLSVQGGGDLYLGGDVEPSATPRLVRGSSGFTARWGVGLDGTPDDRPGAAQIRHVDFWITGPPSDVAVEIARMKPEADLSMALELGAQLTGQPLELSPGYRGEVLVGTTPSATAVPFEGITMRGALPTNFLVAADEADVFAEQWWRRNRPVEGRIGQPPADSDRQALEERVRSLQARLSGALTRGRRQELQRQLAQATTALEHLDRAENPETLSPDAHLEAALEEALQGFQKFQAESEAGTRSSVSRSRSARTLLSNLSVSYEDFAAAFRARVNHSRNILIPATDEWASSVQYASEEVRWFFAERVHYLGPLRQNPHEGGLRTSVSGEVGTRGEFSAATFLAESRRVGLFPVPDEGERDCTLEEAFSLWVTRFGLAQHVRAEDLGRAGVEMRVQPIGLDREVDLTSVGVGVSQILPVLLVCLLAEPPALVLLEQPELHLHPAVQQHLADFLIACARSGRQLIVETHSEYLISRLRLRVAEDISDETRDLFELIFAEIDQGITTFNPVPVNELGGLDVWPAGFFDQMPDESEKIFQAALAKRESLSRDP
jgi:energy-coupling factor transporter ATP-binding protein EcfA2